MFRPPDEIRLRRGQVPFPLGHVQFGAKEVDPGNQALLEEGLHVPQVTVAALQGFGGDVEKDKVFPWDRCDIWYATSEDGMTWKEEGLAVPRGKSGEYDDRSVFTVEIMVTAAVG